MKAAIIVNLSKEKAISCAGQIVTLLREHGASVAMPIECKGHFRSSSITYYYSLRQATLYDFIKGEDLEIDIDEMIF